ncbi:hypothetical protein [Pseudomonas sp. PIC25]|uniref:hypothetical protein n=1 Tax=Pseudomonas sp. PIC25 TaxID=1958773 RepID=UPI001179B5A1|nr:hypothetical protein [Pseudomonas sp. PIC25]
MYLIAGLINQVQIKMMGLKIRDGKGGGYLSERLKFFLNGMSVREESGYNRLVRNEKSISLYGYYLVPKGGVYSYVIGCNSGARCELETFYDDSLDYAVSFDEKYLDDIKYTDEKVRGLIGSMVCI